MYANRLQDSFHHAAQAVEVLLNDFPKVYRLLGDQRLPLDKQITGWAAMRERHQVYQEQGEQPVLVAILYGPTGAGKSTLFRLLTGINVPAGDVRRPTTYACAMAAPAVWIEAPDRLRRLFPDLTLEQLQDMAQLGQPTDSENHVFIKPYSPPESNWFEKLKRKIFYQSYDENDQGFPLILVDVPDFDSIERQNWEKAEALLQRAEIVIFLTTGDKYADDVVVKALQRACRLAARLVYLLTKTASAEHARQKWEDLLHKLAQTPPYATHFQEKRSNGQTLLEFFRGCPVYFSPWSDSPQLKHVQALSAGDPRLEELLRGLPAENLLLESFLEPAIPVVQACQQELATAQELLRKRRHDLEQAGRYCAEAAKRVAASLFPISRMMQIMHEEISQQQSWWAKVLSWPFRILSAPFRMMGSLISALRDAPSQSDVRSQTKLEAENLGKAVEWLLDKWRGDFRPQDAQMLEQARLEPLRQQFSRRPLPNMAADWEVHVRQAARQWAREHPWAVNILPAIADFLAIAGGAVLAIDLFATGGHIGIPALVAAGGAGARILSEFINSAEMEKMANAVHRSYVEQRSRELQQHLEEHLFRPVFQPWHEWIKQMEQAPVARCQQACADLQQLFQQIRQSPAAERQTA
jgi:energy-coupling factor transporter ATP-binding protein EcfA2